MNSYQLAAEGNNHKFEVALVVGVVDRSVEVENIEFIEAGHMLAVEFVFVAP